MSISSVFKAAAPLVGSLVGGIGSSGRAKAATNTAARPILRSASSPFSSFAFDPKTSSVSLTPSAATQSLLDFQLPSSVFDRQFVDEAIKDTFSARNFFVDEAGQALRKNTERLDQLLGELRNNPNLSVADMDRILNELVALEGEIKPGFGKLTEATRSVFGDERQRLLDRRRSSVGDLQENLGRRGILGSSFADDAVGRREAEFGQLTQELAGRENLALAQSAIGEIELTGRNLAQQQGVVESRFQQVSENLNAQFQNIQARLQNEISTLQAQTDVRFQAATQTANLDTDERTFQAEAQLRENQQKFDQLQSLGQQMNDLFNSVQGTFQRSFEQQQQLLAEAARGRGAAFGGAFGDLAEEAGGLFSGGGSGLGLIGGSGTDTFSLAPGPSTVFNTGTTFF